MNHPDRCADCTTRPTCWINGICVIKRDSAKVEAPTPAADAQDSSYRADKLEISRLMSKLAVQSKLTRDAETQRDDMAERINRQCQLLTDQQKDIDHANNKICEIAEGRARAERQLNDLGTLILQQGEKLSGTQKERDRLVAELVGTNSALNDVRQICTHLRAELTAANNSLIAAREQIAALVAEQRESAADRARELREYVTTKQFHQQQASMAPSRGVSIPAAELDVTEQEDEAFKAKWPILKFKSFEGFTGAHTQGLLSSTETGDSSTETARSSTEIRLDDIEQRMERAENAFLVLQGRVNTAHDRLDTLKDI